MESVVRKIVDAGKLYNKYFGDVDKGERLYRLIEGDIDSLASVGYDSNELMCAFLYGDASYVITRPDNQISLL